MKIPGFCANVKFGRWILSKKQQYITAVYTRVDKVTFTDILTHTNPYTQELGYNLCLLIRWPEEAI